ncbi:hypothetical protein [Bariatricus sp. HCP28S3_C2]|uniref:hypothetical protein n=1 Tax=unclassified Bariatricus TaxID=2677046 RepID=UPI003F8A0D0D
MKSNILYSEGVVDIEYVYREVEIREYLLTHLDTGVTERVKVSNRNGLTEEKHLKLLNHNTPNDIFFSKMQH